MGSPVRMEERVKINIIDKITAHFCANVSFFVIKFSPQTITKLLLFLSKNARKPSKNEVEYWRRAISSVNVRCAGNGCLQRSVAVMIWGILKRRVPDWVSGFQISPFIAHAWVELDGEPIGENFDLRNFQKILFVKGHAHDTNQAHQ